jgi:hypothetical protein
MENRNYVKQIVQGSIIGHQTKLVRGLTLKLYALALNVGVH